MQTSTPANPLSTEFALFPLASRSPLMKKMIVGLTLFFFVATFIQLVYLHLSIERTADLDLRDAFSLIDDKPIADFEDQIAVSRMKAMIELEGFALQRRHHQANVLLMSRVWAQPKAIILCKRPHLPIQALRSPRFPAGKSGCCHS